MSNGRWMDGWLAGRMMDGEMIIGTQSPSTAHNRLSLHVLLIITMVEQRAFV